ncbi:MAG: Nif3-like dinuclear metal center hexameric protein, partial [Planctomycetaceae bacterium]|nr:Nif3-like dinuclear metal center hexameric protein [Planctomycetaceae bacterium]
MPLSELIAALEALAPPALSESWDNTGLLLGDRATEVTRALTCLTLTPDVAAEAVAGGVQLVVTHHPLLFKPVQRLTTDSVEGRTVVTLLRAGVAVYSPHTAWDNAPQGINQQLAELCELQDVAPLRSADSFVEPSQGAGRCGRLPRAMTLQELTALVRQRLNAPGLQFVGDPTMKIERLGIACGAAAEFWQDARRADCQALLTGEARFHAALECREAGFGLIVAGHYATERHGMERLAKLLAER